MSSTVAVSGKYWHSMGSCHMEYQQDIIFAFFVKRRTGPPYLFQEYSTIPSPNNLGICWEYRCGSLCTSFVPIVSDSTAFGKFSRSSPLPKVIYVYITRRPDLKKKFLLLLFIWSCDQPDSIFSALALYISHLEQNIIFRDCLFLISHVALVNSQNVTMTTVSSTIKSSPLSRVSPEEHGQPLLT